MKKIVSPAGIIFLVWLGILTMSATEDNKAKKSLKMPDNVKAIIDKSCYECHNTASKNDNAKQVLDFKKFDGLSTIRKIGALKHIGESVENAQMPPKRFLEKNPDKKLTDDKIKIITEWVKKESASLLGK